MTSVLTREIEKLKKMVLALSAMAEKSLEMGFRALETRDLDLAQQVIDEDITIDEMEVELEEDAWVQLFNSKDIVTWLWWPSSRRAIQATSCACSTGRARSTRSGICVPDTPSRVSSTCLDVRRLLR